MKLFYKIVFVFLVLVLMVFFIGNYYGPRLIIEMRNEVFQKFNNDDFPPAADFNLQPESMQIISKDNFCLREELIRTDSAVQKGTVILVHGIHSRKERYYPVCKLLSQNGFNSVVVDLRAHGESEGEYCTYGCKEKEDLVILLDSLDAKDNLSDNYGIWGQSLGAAVALQTLEIDTRLKFGIIESAFIDFSTIVHDYSTNYFGFEVNLLNEYLIWRAENIGDFDAESIKPSESAKSIEQRILVVHGRLDRQVLFEYGLENYENLASKDKEFVAIDSANHTNVWQVGGEAYFQKVLMFLNQ